MTKLLKSITTKAAEIRKALVAAAAVAASVESFSGTPTDLRAVAAAVVATLATFGITYAVANKPA